MNKRQARAIGLAVFGAFLVIEGSVIFGIWCPAMRRLEAQGIPSPGPFPTVRGSLRCWLIFGRYLAIFTAAWLGVTLFGWAYNRWPRATTNGLLVVSLVLTAVGSVGQFEYLAAGLGSLAVWAAIRFGKRRASVST